MACLPTEIKGELEFVHALLARDLGQCRGPLLRIALWPHRVFVLEHIMNSTPASDILWDGYFSDDHRGVQFELCAAHWVDLAALTELRALQYRRSDWSAEAHRLMEDICATAGWDAKEIANMVAWQSERLT